MIKAFEKYLLLEKRYSKHTVNAYIKDIEQFYNYAQITTQEITTDYQIIKTWIISLTEKQKLSKRSVNRKISSLKSYYKYLIRQNKIEKNPLDKIYTLKNPKKIPEFIPEQDFDEINNLFSNDFSGIRDRLILEMFYLTGIRRSELINLTNQDIDTAKKQIKVLGKGQKWRIIPINDYLTDLILKYQKNKENLTDYDKKAFFLTDKGKKVNEKYVYRTVKKYLSKMTTIKQKSPHTLRHTFATHLLNNGADLNAIKELLGHANLSATQIYTHNSYEQLNKIYKQAHPRA
jgi:integrase/recombinase XerC